MKQFLIGLFTHHLVTKVVSLLLASVLFVFTQQGISDTQRIDQLTIEFELDESARKSYMLLGNKVTLTGIEISGLRKELVLRSEELRRAGWHMKKVIDIDFVRRHRGGNKEIRIDAEFCRTEQIPWTLGKNFRLELKNPGVLVIDGIVNRTFRPWLSPEELAKFQLSDASPFRGPDGSLDIFPEFVTAEGNPIEAIAVSGPDSSLPRTSGDEMLKLYIRVRPLTETLAGKTTLSAARAPYGILDIDWVRSGCTQVELLRVNAPQQESPAALRDSTLNVRCAGLILNPIELQVTLPVQFNTANGGWTRERIEREYKAFGPKDGETKFQTLPPNAGIDGWTAVSQLLIKALPQWAGREKEIGELFAIEIDLAGIVAESTAKPDRLEIPVRLRARTSAGEATKALADREIQRAEIWFVYRLRKDDN